MAPLQEAIFFSLVSRTKNGELSDSELRLDEDSKAVEAQQSTGRLVRFDESVEIVDIAGRSDYSEEEMSSYFYSKAEHRQMIALARQIANSKTRRRVGFRRQDNELLDKRGLETLTRVTSIQSRANTRYALAAVLTTQQQQKQKGAIEDDDEEIAKAYRRVTAAVIQEALTRATEDQDVVREQELQGSVKRVPRRARSWKRRRNVSPQ